MKTAIKHGPVAIREPENYTARANLLWTSTLALNGLVGRGRQGGWTCHPIEHELSAYYDITHGVGLAILTPRWMKYCIDKDRSSHAKFATYGRQVWGLTGQNEEELARAAVERTYTFFRDQMEVPMTLPEVGIDSQDLVAEMSEYAVLHGGLGKGKFVNLGVDEVAEIIKSSFTPMENF